MARWCVFGFTCWEPEGSLRESVAYSQVQTTRQHTPIEFSAPTGSGSEGRREKGRCDIRSPPHRCGKGRPS
jgi:hypothetical protein